jgi:predicted ATPase/DNA-binding winged helix-turn-helix (wHTH) protein
MRTLPQVSSPRVALDAGVYDPARRVVITSAGALELTLSEARLLDFFLAHPQEDLAHRRLLSEVWGYSDRAESRTVYSTVGRLRQKIESDPASPRHLLAVARVGYRFELAPERFLPLDPQQEPQVGDALAAGLAAGGSFVGRQGELAALGALLSCGTRLLTLVGTGGTGKTRLAMELAHRHRATFPGGVWLADLTAARDPAGLSASVARALGLQQAQSAREAVGRALSERGRCLLVLDNFEQVAEHAAETVGAWRARASDAVFLVTSRETLKLGAEQIFPVEPLAVPEPGASEASVADCPSVQLFVERARQVRPDFALADSWGAVAEIARGLDGIPLALELAAARMRVLDASTLLARLSRRFEVLTSGRRDLPSRQATLRGAIDGSWALLSEPERRALACCSTFEGGFWLDALAALLGAQGNALDLVQELVDKSLVRTWVPAGQSEIRYGLYESIRAYAAERVSEMGLQAEAEARHLEHFAAWGTPEAVAALSGPGGAGRRRRLMQDRANLHLAVQRALALRSARVVDAAVALVEAVELVGPYREVEQLLLSVTEQMQPEGEALARLTLARSAMLQAAGEVPAARALCEQAIGLLEGAPVLRDMARLALANLYFELSDYESASASARPVLAAALEPRVAVRAAGVVARIDHARGDTEAAERGYLETLARYAELGDARNEANTLATLGALYMDLGRIDSAWTTLERALQKQRAVGNRRQEAAVLGNQGLVAFYTTRYDEADALMQASLALTRQVGDRRMEGNMLGNLALVRHLQDRIPEAFELLRAARVVHREVGRRAAECHVLMTEGSIRVAIDDPAMLEPLEEALQMAREVGQRLYEANILGNMAVGLLKQRRPAEARAAGERAQAILEEARAPRNLASVLFVLAEIAWAEGQPERTRALLERSKAMGEEAGAHDKVARATKWLEELATAAPG